MAADPGNDPAPEVVALDDPAPEVLVTDPVDDPAPEVVAYSSGPEPVAGTGPTRRAKVTATSSLAANPQYQYFDGVIQGNFNVTSESGCGQLGNTCTLSYEFVDASAGGKANLWSSTNTPVPVTLDPLLQDGRKGGAGSFTFLPYATWIDPENPTTTPTPTGSQSFTVRIRENTQLDQTLSNIPLFGSINEKVIHTFQDLGWLSGLLGASLLSTVNVNVELTALGKQVAYTYTVSSFDGTPISMNYFPASGTSLLPNPDAPTQGQQATIMNGPGLGSPGETKPYAAFQASGSVPGIGLMRGQGLPTTPINFSSLKLGFNVITWDPRGEWDSGGILQLDNPFYEGRDVTALIDWALANTPTLVEDVVNNDDPENPVTVASDVPAIAMMGGSYGGGIQMTTVDPRVKSIVPSIAWNSLNESLYPDNVFKTGWANVLASALLLTGASSLDRVNSQITQALITGNLFGFISESAQAVLASSGPTTLLSKLNAPVLFNQGIVDALFPLQQAVENAQTLLETNPYLNGTIDPGVYPYGVKPKMIWFCGGHGVCTTQTLAQQTAQGTAMFLQDMIWVNQYTKEYLKDTPINPPLPSPPFPFPIDNTGILFGLVFPAVMKTFQWWDQTGTALASDYNVWTAEFQNGTPVVATNATGGRINSFTSSTGPLKESSAAGAVCESISQACEFPLNQVFATDAKNAVNVDISVPGAPGSARWAVGQPLVSFTYSGRGNAKAVYAQIVDNASGQVLGNINTPIPVTLNGREQTVVDFPIANIAYTAPADGGSLTLQLVASSSLFKNNDVIWSVDISDISVTLPTTRTAVANPIVALLPS